MRIERNNNIFKDLHVRTFSNLNFIEEITYLTPPPPPKAMKNMHECRPGLWGLDTPPPPGLPGRN